MSLIIWVKIKGKYAAESESSEALHTQRERCVFGNYHKEKIAVKKTTSKYHSSSS